MGKIVAIGGGENGRPGTAYETGLFDAEIVRLTGKDDPNFLFIGLANSHADSYYETMCAVFHDRLGCSHTDHLLEADLRDPDTLRRKIEWADFIYVGGGNTLRLMTLLRRWGGDRLLDEAYRRGTVLSGISAGGICWCSCGSLPAAATSSSRSPGWDICRCCSVRTTMPNHCARPICRG